MKIALFIFCLIVGVVAFFGTFANDPDYKGARPVFAALIVVCMGFMFFLAG